jgi:hypothetical protein
MEFNKKCSVDKIVQLICKFSYKRFIESQGKPSLLRRLDNQDSLLNSQNDANHMRITMYLLTSVM